MLLHGFFFHKILKKQNTYPVSIEPKIVNQLFQSTPCKMLEKKTTTHFQFGFEISQIKRNNLKLYSKAILPLLLSDAAAFFPEQQQK